MCGIVAFTDSIVGGAGKAAAGACEPRLENNRHTMSY